MFFILTKLMPSLSYRMDAPLGTAGDQGRRTGREECGRRAEVSEMTQRSQVK